MINYQENLRLRERERGTDLGDDQRFLPAREEGDFSHFDLQMAALYPRAIRPSATIFLQNPSLRLLILCLSTIFAVSANKFLSDKQTHGTKLCLYNRNFPKKVDQIT